MFERERVYVCSREREEPTTQPPTLASVAGSVSESRSGSAASEARLGLGLGLGLVGASVKVRVSVVSIGERMGKPEHNNIP